MVTGRVGAPSRRSDAISSSSAAAILRSSSLVHVAIGNLLIDVLASDARHSDLCGGARPGDKAIAASTGPPSVPGAIDPSHRARNAGVYGCSARAVVRDYERTLSRGRSVR